MAIRLWYLKSETFLYLMKKNLLSTVDIDEFEDVFIHNKEVFFPDDYDLICEIDTHNLDEAMSLAQNIDFSNSIHNNNLRSSATVGDIFETEKDGSYVVAPVGFKSLDTNTIFDPTSTKSIIMNQHPTGRKS